MCTGVPLALVNMRTGEARNYPWTPGGASILSDLGSLTMEFSYLSDITGVPVYRCVKVCIVYMYLCVHDPDPLVKCQGVGDEADEDGEGGQETRQPLSSLLGANLPSVAG